MVIVREVLRLRIIQFSRTLMELGLLRCIILIPFLGIACITFVKGLLALQALYTALLAAFCITSIHVQRSDLSFIQMIRAKPFSWLFLEYSMACIPFCVLLIIQQSWYYIPLLWLYVFILAWFNPQLNWKKSGRTLVVPLLPAAAFEWRSGLRQKGWQILVLTILGVCFSSYAFVPLVSIFVVNLLSGGFFLEGESQSILEATGNSPSQHIRKKLRLNLSIFILVAAPQTIAFLAFHLDLWYILLVVLILSAVFQILIVLLKYTFYEPGQQINPGAIASILAFNVFSLLFPFLWPIPILMILRYRNRSLKNLNIYLS